MSVPIDPLTKDVCCRKDMLWASKLDASISEEAFAEALERQQFVRAAGAAPIAGLCIFDHRVMGHRVIYVSRTGRIQIRLDPLTSHEDRCQAAEQLFELIRLASMEASEQTPDAPDASSG